eukprot:SAG31_NODE_10225_length_1168_cov_1.076707_1_plen_211_part_00
MATRACAVHVVLQVNIDVSKYWTREAASKVKRWDHELGRPRGGRRASPLRYNANARTRGEHAPGILPPSDAISSVAVQEDLFAKHLPSKHELQTAAAYAAMYEADGSAASSAAKPAMGDDVDTAQNGDDGADKKAVKFEAEVVGSDKHLAAVRHGRRRGSPTRISPNKLELVHSDDIEPARWVWTYCLNTTDCNFDHSPIWKALSLFLDT